MKQKQRRLPDEIIFGVCEKLIKNGERPTEIASWVTGRGFPCSREQIYSIFSRGIEKGFLRLSPPPEIELARSLMQKYHIDFTVLNVGPDTIGAPIVVERLGAAAADLAVRLIHEVHTRTGKKSVHLGFGHGETVQKSAWHLGSRLKNEAQLPEELVLHALSTGVDVKHPSGAPVSFFSFFTETMPRLKLIGLFAEAYVDLESYEEFKNKAWMREAFQQGGAIDIVMTSLASAKDRDNLFRKFIKDSEPKDLQYLRSVGWLGDIMWRTYSDTAPIITGTRGRAVTIFELSDLVDLAQQDDKHVILIAGPCGECGRVRTDALLPLLREPSLRVCNHIVTDSKTAAELLKA